MRGRDRKQEVLKQGKGSANRMDMRDEIKAILKKMKGEWFEEEENLFSDGYIDSFELIRLIVELEEAFHIKIQDDKVSPESFNSIDRICKLITNAKKEG